MGALRCSFLRQQSPQPMKPMQKPATVAYPVNDLVLHRWSPRAFEETPLGDRELVSILEAGRWASSCFNDQPWRFLVGRKGRGAAWQGIYDALAPSNRLWCERVPVLMLSVAVSTFRHNGAANRHSQHDVGMASAQMALQAQSMGLALHFMAGFDRAKVRGTFGIPEDHEPMAAIAAGHPASADVLPEPVRTRELAARERLGLADVAFASWGVPLHLE
jgi:nitroreductase